MPTKDITSAIGLGSATGIDAIHSLEAEISELDTIVADPRGFLSKHKLPVTAQSQVHTTVVRRPAAAALVRPTHIIVIVAHFSNCDTVVVIFVA